MDNIIKDNNKKKQKLAIVIPAYKAKFLSETLDSIASQTDKRFFVYIGDDNSPEGISKIVSRYKGKFDYVYHRFENNIGRKNLVAQWERCIDMTQGEDWIWLFSDDDYMDPTCIESFYREIDKNNKIELIRFNVNIVDEKSSIKKECIFPSFVTSTYLFKNKLTGKISVFAVEYIFSRDVYNRLGGFQYFDLAWGSDTATWVKFGEKGIITIPSSRVYWRKSEENITGQSETNEGYLRKFRASNSFLLWSRDYWKSRNVNYDFFIDSIFIRRLHEITSFVPYILCIDSAQTYWGNNKIRRFFLIAVFHLYQLASKFKLTKR